MKLALALIALCAGRAYAGTCDVAIVRAPDDVREVVEAWLRPETCVVPLEVRIMKVERGLYVIALDSRQRVRERVVPDAQSAGVLIASWAADDQLPTQSLSVELSYTPPVLESPTVVAPSMTPASPLHVDQPISPPAIHANKTWTVLGTVVLRERGDGAGIRGELDLFSRRRWRAGIAASFAESYYRFDQWSDDGEIETLDVQAMGYLAYVLSTGRWQMRGALAAGLVGSYVEASVTDHFDPTYANPSYQPANALGVFPIADASLTFGWALTERWMITTGVLATWFAQEFENSMSPSGSPLPARGAQLMWLAGLRRAR